ncbi:hypothetical protein BC830DRAFT_1167383 [Chytriomyces sp. MP71]|nr:hypothetical protein BC830DRAFT_1167383 [Chytriomyces sp. MP71]
MGGRQEKYKQTSVVKLMNQTINGASNATAANIWDPFNEALATVNQQSVWIAVGMSTVALALLIGVVGRKFTCEAESASLKKTVFNQINVLIFSLIVSNLLFEIFNALLGNLFADQSSDFALSIAYSTIANLFYFIFQFLLIYYSWVRNFPIIKNGAPWSLPYLRVAIVVYTILQATLFTIYVLSWVVSAEQLDALYAVLPNITLAAEIILCTFDVFILINFILFLHNSSRQNMTLAADQLKFTIIARFGIATFVVVQLMLASTVGANEAFAPSIPIMSVTTYTVLYNFQMYTPLVFIFLQVAMKWSLLVMSEGSKVAPAS